MNHGKTPNVRGRLVYPLPDEEIPMLTTEELAGRWGMSPKTLRNWRCNNRGPAYTIIGGRVKYPEDFVKEYEEDNTVIPTR